MHHHYDTVYEHLVIKGMDPIFTTCVFYGEQLGASNQNVVEMPESSRMFKDFYTQHDVDPENHPNGRDEEIESLVNDAETPLYPDCRAFTKMSASITIFKHKASCGLSDNGFDELINLVRDMLSDRKLTNRQKKFRKIFQPKSSLFSYNTKTEQDVWNI